MSFSSRQFARLIRLACLAMLMAALAPTVSQLLASRACHTEQAADQHGAHKQAGHALGAQCGYCVMQADLPYLPLVPALSGVADAHARSAPPAARDTPLAPTPRLSAQPRAPPLG